MASFPRYYIDDGLPGALCMHLGLYCAVAGGLAFGFYLLMQPTYSPNPGVAAYKAPPGTVISNALPSRLKVAPESVAATVVMPETDGRSTPQPAVETNGRSAQQPVQSLAIPSTSPPRSTKKPSRQANTEQAKPQASACIPGYDSSGAQTRPC